MCHNSSGVGDGVNPEELRIIGGDDKPGFFNVLHNFKDKYSSDSNKQSVFRISSFTDLESVVENIAIQTCTGIALTQIYMYISCPQLQAGHWHLLSPL